MINKYLFLERMINLRNIDNYVKQYLETNDFEKYQVKYRRKRIIDSISKYNHDSILEIGCGMEPIGFFIDDLDKYTIIEPSETFANNARNMFKDNYNLDYSWKYHKAHAIRLYAIF